MTIDDLLMPVSADAPCGPDLDAAMDPAFEEYYFSALGRLPSFYARPGVERPDGTASPDSIFQPSSVDIAAERRELEPLLARSRDLRLLVLLAQWEILAGRLEPMAETCETIAALMETFGSDLHPGLSDGIAPRRDALADLASQATVIQPLLFLGLTGTDEISLRKIKVAAGELAPLQNEVDLLEGGLSGALSDPGNAKRVDQNHAALVRLRDALWRIAAGCQGNADAPFSPPLDALVSTVTQMLDAIALARPDLSNVPVPEEAAAPVSAATNAAVPPTAVGDATGAAASAVPASTIKSHAHARATLEACEGYFAKAEPSSAALLLVTQARLLIGRPLVEAIETLLPDKASQALVDFGPQTGFALNIDRLRQLSQASALADHNADLQPDGDAPVQQIESGAEAAGAMGAVEDYFRQTEKSSPVPILLNRARSYLDKDFEGLLGELFPRSDSGQE